MYNIRRHHHQWPSSRSRLMRIQLTPKRMNKMKRLRFFTLSAVFFLWILYLFARSWECTVFSNWCIINCNRRRKPRLLLRSTGTGSLQTKPNPYGYALTLFGLYVWNSFYGLLRHFVVDMCSFATLRRLPLRSTMHFTGIRLMSIWIH